MARNLREPFIETIQRRLLDKEWRESPIGEIAQLLVDNECCSVRDIASVLGKHPVTITRWFKEIKTPGNGHREKQLLELKLITLHIALLEALANDELTNDGTGNADVILKYMRS